jgi:hypothetical protein
VQVVGLREMACFQELLGCAERTAEGGCPYMFSGCGKLPRKKVWNISEGMFFGEGDFGKKC